MIKLIVGLLFGLSIQAHTQEVTSSFRDFSGGLNDRVATVALPVNESPDLQNVMIDEPIGALTTRKGITQCGTTPSGSVATGIYEYIRNNGNRDLILTDNTSVWSTADCVIFSTITTGLNAVAVPYFDTFRDKLWITNKSTNVYTWDGTTATQLDGVGTHPTVPKGQYITHWKERVWIARDTNPSAVYFSSLSNDAGVAIDPSISSNAWPTLNAFYIAQDDGSPIYGLKVYRDNLFVFKETGIWRIIFESVFNTQVVKSVSNIGCKFQDSIVELDNYLYFMGNDGIYKFDGNDVVRVSDKIHNTFASLKQPSRLDKFKTWSDYTDFIQGSLSNTTTKYYETPNTQSGGRISLNSELNQILYQDFESGTISSTWTKPTDAYALCSISSSKMLCTKDGSGYRGAYTPNTNAYGKWEMDATLNSSIGTQIDFISFNPTSRTHGYGVFINGNSQMTLQKYTHGTSSNLCSNFSLSISIPSEISVTRSTGGIFNVYYNGDSLACSATDTSFSSSTYMAVYNLSGVFGDIYFDNIYSYQYPSTGTFTSEISTHTDLTLWKTFDVEETLSGQSIAYSVRTATSVATIGSVAYASITPGATVSTITANKYAQWKATFTTTDNSVTPLLNSVTLNWQEGDSSSSRVTSVNHNNRMWMSGSSTPANAFNDIVLVKTKTPLENWVKFDLQIAAMSKWNNNLYGTSAVDGKIYRLDHGTSDNGSAINAYWSWKDEHFNTLAYKKTLTELYSYFIPTNATNTKLQYSRDGGTNWNTLSLDMSGTQAFGVKRLLFNGGNANAFRFKIYNNTLDEAINYLGFDAFANPYRQRE